MTGGCSSMSTVSGKSPPKPAAATALCRSHASRYRTCRSCATCACLAMFAAYRRPKRGRLCRPRCTCATQRGAHGGNRVSPVKATSVSRFVRGLELFAQVAQEAARQRTVDEPVFVRQRQVHDRPYRDHVLAPDVLAHLE